MMSADHILVAVEVQAGLGVELDLEGEFCSLEVEATVKGWSGPRIDLATFFRRLIRLSFNVVRYLDV